MHVLSFAILWLSKLHWKPITENLELSPNFRKCFIRHLYFELFELCHVEQFMNLNFSYLAVRDAQKAANCLARRSERSALRAAILVLLAAGHAEQANVYAQKYVHECLLELDWPAAADIIAADPSFQVNNYIAHLLAVSIIRNETFCCCYWITVFTMCSKISETLESVILKLLLRHQFSWNYSILGRD